MKNLEKKVMIFGVVAMLGLSLLLCFVSPEDKAHTISDTTQQCSNEKEP